jgi:cytochrome c oxidase assembly protein subunit 11
MSNGPLKNKVFVSLLGAVTFMFFFSFMLVPLYNVFCEVTGLNGKIYGPSDFFQKK